MQDLADASVVESISRKEKFRQYFRAFNPSASPFESIKDGLVLNDLRPESLYQKIAARVELEPESLQALVGGIGSGKTTELLLVVQRLRELDIHGFYFEVSRHVDVTKAKPGFLVGLVADSLLNKLGNPTEFVSERARLSAFLYGHWRPLSYEDVEPDENEMVFVEGVVARPVRPEEGISESARADLARIASHYQEVNRPLAVLVDGLDRIQDIEEFGSLITPDLLALQWMSIPVVCVTPLSLQFASHSAMRERFDRIHELSAIQILAGALRRILKKRDIHGLLTDAASRALTIGSGGILRDLVTLARDAGEEAYVSGAASITKEHVAVAVQQLGRSYARGLSKQQRELLVGCIRTQSFDPSNPDVLSLISSRRIVEYSSTSFSVHPALEGLLERNDFF